MSDWIDVMATAALAEGDHVVAEVDGVDVVVFRIDGALYAVQDVCTHDGAEIASGRREGYIIICPRHGAKFCLKTGKIFARPGLRRSSVLSCARGRRRHPGARRALGLKGSQKEALRFHASRIAVTTCATPIPSRQAGRVLSL